MAFVGLEDKTRMEQEMSWEDRDLPVTFHQLLSRTAGKFPNHNAISFQLFSGPNDKAETLTWSELLGKVNQAANLFRSLGVGEKDVVAYVLPNCNETLITMMGGAVAGIVNPINPLLEPEQIAAILRETGAKVVVTLKSFPKTDVAQKVEEAVRQCIAAAAPCGGFMLSSSNSIHSSMNPENYLAMVRAGQKYGGYPLDEELLAG